MGREDDPGSLLDGVFDGRYGTGDTGVFGDAPVIVLWHVQVGPPLADELVEVRERRVDRLADLVWSMMPTPQRNRMREVQNQEKYP